MTNQSRIRQDILEEHLDELDFLWQQRTAVLFDPQWTVDDLIELEARIEAHVDALRLGGPLAVSLARDALSGGDEATVSAAALALLEMDHAGLAQEVLAVFRDGDEAAAEGTRLALRHCEPRLVSDGLYEAALGANDSLRARAADVLAFHRLQPPPEIERLLDHQEPEVARLGFEAAGRFGRAVDEARVRKALHSPAADLHRVALEASARCGLSSAAALCRASIRERWPSRPAALAFLGIVGAAADVQLLTQSIVDGEDAIAAIKGLGRLGTTAAVPALIEAMLVPEIAAGAATAFIQITGVPEDDIASLDAERSDPTSGDVDDELDDDDSDGITPDPQRARRVWSQVGLGLSPNGRFQMGRDVLRDPVGSLLRELPLAARRDTYFLLCAQGRTETARFEIEARIAPPRRE